MATEGSEKTLTPHEALVALRPETLDLKAVIALVGDNIVNSHREVGLAFGKAATTIKQSWQPAGMPRHGKRYRLAEIVLWRIQYERDLQQPRREEDAETRRRRERAEADRMEALAIRAAYENEVTFGEWVRLTDVQAATSSILAVLSQRLMNLPHQIAPSIPTELVPTIVPFLESKIGKALTWCSEELRRKVTRGEDGDHEGAA